jgi:transcriptional regulator with XRE-family HTH domain
VDYLQSEMDRLSSDPNVGFVIKYMAAMKSGLSREQLAGYLGVAPQTLMKKRLKVSNETGVTLDVLDQTADATIPADLLDEFEENIEILEDKQLPTRIESFATNKRYVITSAQNATPVNKQFLDALLHYCEINDAELLVIPLRYKNPNSIWSAQQQDSEYWSPELAPYIQGYSRKLGKSLEYLGFIKIQPTAVNPLTGFESYTGLDSGIFGHPKVALNCIATPSQNLPKILMTTGSITHMNFTDSKAGHKGAFHHSFAAVVAEIDGKGHHHLRHVHFNTEENGFYDLDSFYGPKAYVTGVRASCLITGDSHAEFLSKSVEQGT